MRVKKKEAKEKKKEPQHVIFTITLKCENRTTARVSKSIADWLNSRHVTDLILQAILLES